MMLNFILKNSFLLYSYSVAFYGTYFYDNSGLEGTKR